MEPKNYWTELNSRRVSRRYILRGAAVGATGIAAAAIVGCGDDDDAGTNGNGTPAPGGSGATATATAAGQPIKGGIWRGILNVDPPSLDPVVETREATAQTILGTYSRLLRLDTGPHVPAGAINPVANTAESWEVAPDGLTYTFALNPKAKFHPPISRSVTAEDIVYSYERYHGRVGNVTPGTDQERYNMVESVTAPDASHVVFKLKTPFAAFLYAVADPKAMLIMPPEIDTTGDAARHPVGNGPWIFEEYRPGSLFRFVRNPDWHLGPDAPYFDSVELSIVQETTTQVNQFLGGNIDGLHVEPRGLIDILSEMSDAQVAPKPIPRMHFIFFSAKDPDAPWVKDKRVRQAISMGLDRDAITSAAYPIEDLAAAGYDVNIRWTSEHMAPQFANYWLDPQGGDMEPTPAGYYKYDVAAAKALLAEAGYPDGFTADFSYPNNQYGDTYNLISELIPQMLSDIGINLNTTVMDYSSQFVTGPLKKEFQGLSNVHQQPPEPGDYFTRQFLKDSGRNWSSVDDPTLEQRILDFQAMTDLEERRLEILDVQNYLSEQMYYVPCQYGAIDPFVAYQANIGNGTDYVTVGTGSELDEVTPFLYKK